MDHFITEIFVEKVRHLQNFRIRLSEDKRKHLILTGKNGSGKTSLILAIRDSLQYQIDSLDKGPSLAGSEVRLPYDDQKDLLVKVKVPSEPWEIPELFLNGEFILAFFPAKRSFELKEPKGVQKLDKPAYFPISFETVDFLQFLVNLRATRSFSRDEGEEAKAEQIDQWFLKLEKLFAEILEDKQIRLVFDSDNFTFYFDHPKRGQFGFNALSDGYASLLNLVTALIYRMQDGFDFRFDKQGIVLIDEIEAHLHIDLQKKVFPLLVELFPNLQFIISTHSPFVITSYDKSILFDLENRVRIEDLTHYSVDSVIESYFDSDKYSEMMTERLKEYEYLLAKENRSPEESLQLRRLKKYFEDAPKIFSPELKAKLQQLQLANLGKKDD